MIALIVRMWSYLYVYMNLGEISSFYAKYSYISIYFIFIVLGKDRNIHPLGSQFVFTRQV